MNLLKLFLLSLALFLVNPTDAISCYAGRAGCYGSCVAQNCATGYCVPEGAPLSQQTCVCSRCTVGPWPKP